MSDSSSPVQGAMTDALRTVMEPSAGRDVITLGLLRNLAFHEGVVQVTYELPAAIANEATTRHLRQASVAALRNVKSVKMVNVEFAVREARPQPTGAPLPGVRHVIAVGAGKGGVGKSTIAVLAAVGLQRRGLRVGLLDGDVYGPSIPKLTGTEGAEPRPCADGRVSPPEFDGIKVLSMGYLVAPDQAIVWRGPMAQKYVKEFIDRGDWGELDVLIVDLPPGTGDIPLTLAQTIPLTGAVVVCTPQDVALLDAVRALRMYEKLGVTPLGIIENMSYYVCPHCGRREEIFSHGGAEKAARDLGVAFLGAIPLNISIRIHGDDGRPSACFAKIEPSVIAALDEFVDRLLSAIRQREQDAAPPPTLRVSG
ncbi:MAG: P-loop NTPase [Phycisphaerae bacterium]